MKKKVTIYDIAKELNITGATVSRALNNNSKISDDTRELVKKMAVKMNYKPNRLALALKSGKSNSVGVIVPHVNRNFFSSIIRGIEEELYPHGYHVIISQTYNNEKREVENITALLNAQADGIFMSISNISKENEFVIDFVLKNNVPLIFFDRKKEMKNVSSVTIDDFNGGYIATKHLIEQGCKKIAHLAGDRSLEIYKDRFMGYKKALSDSNIEFNDKYVFETKSDIEEGKNVTRELLKMASPPDAIFSASDFAALGAIQEVKFNGIDIPREFCIVGFSNEPFTKYMELSITSVDQFPLEMGKMAAKVFLEQVDGRSLKIEKKVVLDPKLHIRKSSLRTKKLKEKEF